MDNTSACLAYSDSLDWANFCYRRINHLSEWLSNCQGRESIQVPQEVIESVMDELFKRRIPKEGVNRVNVRACLKALGHRKFYENSNLIASMITGKKPVQLTRQEEDIIKRMFMAIQDSFAEQTPSRSNFLSYATSCSSSQSSSTLMSSERTLTS